MATINTTVTIEHNGKTFSASASSVAKAKENLFNQLVSLGTNEDDARKASGHKELTEKQIAKKQASAVRSENTQIKKENAEYIKMQSALLSALRKANALINSTEAKAIERKKDIVRIVSEITGNAMAQREAIYFVLDNVGEGFNKKPLIDLLKK